MLPFVEILILPADILLFLTTMILLISRNWRWTTVALSVQYLGAFVLVLTHWPLEQAVVKLVGGWMAAAVLGATRLGAPALHEPEETRPTGAVFQVLSGGLVALIVISAAPEIMELVSGMEIEQVWGGLLLIGMGLLILGLSSHPLRVALGLLVAFSGFEIFYAAVESSVLVTGLLALVNLSLALVGTYLFLAPDLEAPDGVP